MYRLSVDFRETPGAVFTLPAEAGAYTMAGQDASLSAVSVGTFPTVPTTGLATFTLTPETSGTNAWCVGHAFAPGDLPSGSTLSGIQHTVKSAWPDGSAKIAILASGCPMTAATARTVGVQIGTAPSGATLTTAHLKSTGITASIDTAVNGSASWSGIEWDSPWRTWVAGPLMSSWIYRKPIGIHPHLVAWLEVRLFTNGEVEVLPWIENGYLYKASPGPVADTYTFTLGGAVRWGPTAVTIGHHTRQPLVNSTALSHWLGIGKRVTPKHNPAYMASTGLVQKYLANVERSSVSALPAYNGVSPSFEPWAVGTVSNSTFPTVMGAGGGHVSIGAQPGWEAIALTCAGTLAFEQMIRESYRFGRYHIHFRDENTNRVLAFADHPTASVSNNTIHAILDGTGGGTPVPTPSGAVPHESERWAASHQPAAPLLAYLTTGRWWFAEECQHITAANYLLNRAYRNGSDCLFAPTGQETRKAAWCIRNLFIAACVTPDDDPLKASFDGAVQKNIEYFWSQNIDGGKGNPFGLVETGLRHPIDGTGSGSIGGAQVWQYDFWTAAWGRAIAFRVGAAAELREKARDFFYWTTKSIVGRCGTTAADEWLMRDLSATLNPESYTPSRVGFVWPGSDIYMEGDGTGVYGVATGPGTPATYPDYDGGTGPWWSSWGEMYGYMMVGQGAITKTDGPLRGGYINDPDGNFWNAFQALAAAAAHSAPGAVDAVTRLRASSNWASLQSTNVGRIPTNSVDYVTLPLEDFSQPWMPTVGARLNVNANNASDVDYDLISGIPAANRWWRGYGQTSSAFRSMVSSYSGSTWAPEYSSAGAIVVHGGGHGGNIGAFGYLFDFTDRLWKIVGAPGNLPTNLEWAGYTNFADNNSYNPALEQRDPDWLDYNYGGSYIKFSDHEYLQNGYVSPSEGGGPKGSLYLGQSTFSQDPGVPDPRTGISYRWAPHLFDLATGVMTRATATTYGAGSWAGYSATLAIKDTTRNRMWFFRSSTPHIHYHDLTSGPPYTRTAHTIQKASGGTTTSFGQISNCSGLYVEDADAIIIWQPSGANSSPPAIANNPVGFRLLNMATGLPVDLLRSGMPSQNFAYGGLLVGCAWVPASGVGGVGKFYLYEGFGDTFMYTLTPSSLDFTTCTFTWGKESFTGPTPPYKDAASLSDGQRRAAQGKLVYVPAYGVLAWHDGPVPTGTTYDSATRNGIVQFWRPPGIPI